MLKDKKCSNHISVLTYLKVSGFRQNSTNLAHLNFEGFKRFTNQKTLLLNIIAIIFENTLVALSFKKTLK